MDCKVVCVCSGCSHVMEAGMAYSLLAAAGRVSRLAVAKGNREWLSLDQKLPLCGRFPGLYTLPCHKNTPKRNDWGGGSQERPDFLISCCWSGGRSGK